MCALVTGFQTCARPISGPVVATMIATSMTGCAGDDNSKWRLLETDAPPSTHGDWRVPSMSGADFVTAYLIESGVAGHTGDTSKLKLMADPGDRKSVV